MKNNKGNVLEFLSLVISLSLLVIFAMFVLMQGCSDASIKRLTTYGHPFKITLYSGGNEVRVFESTGRVLTDSQNDIYSFEEKRTGKLIKISGDVVMEEIK